MEIQTLKRGDSLDELTAIAQLKADDASEDHYYVGDGAGVEKTGSVGCMYDPDLLDTVPARRLEMLIFGVVQIVRIHRANGGVGRGVLQFMWSDVGIEAKWEFWTSSRDAFDAVRSAA